MARSNITSNVDPGALRRRPTVLLVEEDESVRAVAGVILEREGYRVVRAGSAREALKVWEQHSHEVEVLFTDVHMNGMGGTKLAEILLALNPRLTVLFSSGGCLQNLRSAVAHWPNAGFLAKPYTLNQLRLSIEFALQQAAAGAGPTQSVG
jgi:two-component system cell cycle sensor histidine kinase/response regulator CckA